MNLHVLPVLKWTIFWLLFVGWRRYDSWLSSSVGVCSWWSLRPPISHWYCHQRYCSTRRSRVPYITTMLTHTTTSSSSMVVIIRPLITTCDALLTVELLFIVIRVYITNTDVFLSCLFASHAPRAGSGVVRMDPLRFLAGCLFASRAGFGVVRIDLLRFLARCLNQALSVLSPSLGFLSTMVCVLCSSLGPLLCCVICLLVWLGCQCQCKWKDWKDSSPKWPVMCWWGC